MSESRTDPSVPLHPVLERVIERIRERSAPTRQAFVGMLAASRKPGRYRQGMGCANAAHAWAALPGPDKLTLAQERQPHLGIVTAYNDMLSAHQPYEHYPPRLREAARQAGATAQVAGGVPAMCDGVTQGEDGLELSLFSRDVIALSTAAALSHDETAQVRQQYAQGLVGRAELLASEQAAYHGPGTCTFYGTANSNQMLMEIMGLHLPGSSFVNPGTPLREALTDAAVRQAVHLSQAGSEAEPAGMGWQVDERVVVNGIVGLLATGGSTNHTLHLVAMARAAGLVIDWDDFSELSAVVPLLARVYPNGQADVNHFHAAGGMGFLIRELLGVGLLHEGVQTIVGRGLRAYTQEPHLIDGQLAWRPAPAASGDEDVLRPASRPFSADGGLRLMAGNLGRAVVKVSAVKPEHRVVRAPAVVVTDQKQLEQRFKAGELNHDFVAVVREQGPRANGMPELHKLTPVLAVLQDQGFHVALVTDGRMSGASGKVPAAIHLSPESLDGGAIALVQDGDVITVDCERGVLQLEVDEAVLAARPLPAPQPQPAWLPHGRQLFGLFRQGVSRAEQGASPLFPADPTA